MSSTPTQHISRAPDLGDARQMYTSGAETFAPAPRPVIVIGRMSTPVLQAINETHHQSMITVPDVGSIPLFGASALVHHQSMITVPDVGSIPLVGASALVVDGAAVRTASEDAKAALRRLPLGRSGSHVVAFDPVPVPDLPLSAELAGTGITVLRGDNPADIAALHGILAADHPRQERVLAIGAHCDDIEIGCGGALLLHALAGDEIHILTLSRGAMGGDPTIRFDESRAVQKHVGAGLTICEFPDTHISDGAPTVSVIEQVAFDFQPSIVYVHGAHDVHQDHRAVHAATRSAARGVPTLLGYRSPSTTHGFTPTHFIGLDTVIEEKVALLGMHASQSHRDYMQPDHIRSVARYMGAQVQGVTYAEPFETLRSSPHVH